MSLLCSVSLTIHMNVSPSNLNAYHAVKKTALNCVFSRWFTLLFVLYFTKYNLEIYFWVLSFIPPLSGRTGFSMLGTWRNIWVGWQVYQDTCSRLLKNPTQGCLGTRFLSEQSENLFLSWLLQAFLFLK